MNFGIVKEERVDVEKCHPKVREATGDTWKRAPTLNSEDESSIISVGGSSLVHVKLVTLPDNKTILMPTDDLNASILLRLVDGNDSCGRFNKCASRINVEIEAAEKLPSEDYSAWKPFINPPVLPALPTPIANAPPPKEKIITAKHIYKTSGDSYRIQMSAGTKSVKTKKFSRNVRNESDALWVCEYALILIDGPESFDDVLKNGNFGCLVQRGMVSTATEFKQKLVDLLPTFLSRKLLKRPEYDHLSEVLQRVQFLGYRPIGNVYSSNLLCSSSDSTSDPPIDMILRSTSSDELVDPSVFRSTSSDSFMVPATRWDLVVAASREPKRRRLNTPSSVAAQTSDKDIFASYGIQGFDETDSNLKGDDSFYSKL